METDLWTQFAQFGTAGLMAWMWLSERRGALNRERELSESHARLMEQRVQVDALLRAVADSARSGAALEAGQRAISAAVDRIAEAIRCARRRDGGVREGSPPARIDEAEGAAERPPGTLRA